MWGGNRGPMRPSLWALASCVLMIVLLRRASVVVDEHDTPAHSDDKDSFFRGVWETSRKDATTSERPVMYTFFQRIAPSQRSTGMADYDDERLLQVWEKAWHAAGWEPRILTLEDAQRHADFFVFSQTLSGILDSTYQRLTFLRWLAMAEVGGGWMCDYDTFPLMEAPPVMELPNQGQLTFFDPIPSGGAVPSLVSGSGAEWNRVAQLLLKTASQYAAQHDGTTSGGGWGDQRCVVELAKTAPDSFLVEKESCGVVKGRLVLSFPANVCQVTRNCAALHLSHRGIHKTASALQQTAADRAEVAVTWLQQWTNTCQNDGDANNNNNNDSIFGKASSSSSAVSSSSPPSPPLS